MRPTVVLRLHGTRSFPGGDFRCGHLIAGTSRLILGRLELQSKASTAPRTGLVFVQEHHAEFPEGALYHEQATFPDLSSFGPLNTSPAEFCSSGEFLYGPP